MNKLKRLHFAAIIVTFIQTLRIFFFPLVFSFFLGGSEGSIGFFRFEYIWILILLYMFLSGIAEWYSFKYKLDEGELYVEKGIFVKKKRYIQSRRVQSVDISAGIIQRLFGLVKLTIETAGGGAEPEVQLVAIRREEAEKIRLALLQTSVEKGNDEREADPIWTLSNERLFIAALTSSGVGIVISAVLALFSQIEEFLPETIYEKAFRFLSESSIIFIVVIVMTIVIIAWIISMIGTMLKYANFHITKAGEEFVISRGLLEQRQLTLHENRITAVRIVRNLLRQPFGFATVYVESAGGGSQEEQLSTVLFPLIKESEIAEELSNVLPTYCFAFHIEPIPKRALPRALFRVTIIPLFITLVVALVISPLGYYGFIVVFISLILGFFQYRDAGTGNNDQYIWIRYRKVSQITVISKRQKVQAVEVSASFFQRRRDLATFRFSILSSVAGKTFSVVDVDKERSNSLLLSFKRK